MGRIERPCQQPQLLGNVVLKPALITGTLHPEGLIEGPITKENVFWLHNEDMTLCSTQAITLAILLIFRKYLMIV